MKKLLILSGITLLTSLTNTQTLQVSAASETSVIDTYGSNYQVLSTINDIYDETKDTPEASNLAYTDMGYRKHMIHLYNDEGGAHNITKQLFPYEQFVKTSSSGLDYIPVKDSSGNQKYSTFYYDHYSENLNITKTTGKSYMEYTIDITGMENALQEVVNTYKDKVKTNTLFEIPLVYFDDQEVCGYLVDTSQAETNVYIYSKVGTLEVTEDYGYYFLTFRAPYQQMIYDITLFNYDTFTSLEQTETYNYPQTWTTFLPASWMTTKIQPMLFEVLDYDRVNHQFKFGHSAYNPKNQAYSIDFDDFNIKSVMLDMYTSTLNSSGEPSNTSAAGKITVDLELVGKSEDGVYTYEIIPEHFTLYEENLSEDAGQVDIEEVNYVLMENGNEKAVTYKHTYSNNHTNQSYKYCKNKIMKIAYIRPYKLLTEASTLKELYSDKFDEETVNSITKHSNVKHYLGSVYEPDYNMSNTMFAQSYGFNLTMDELNYKKINNPFEIWFDYKTLTNVNEGGYAAEGLSESDYQELLTKSYMNIPAADLASKVINHKVANELLEGYNNYNGLEFDYTYMNFFNKEYTDINAYQSKPIRVRYYSDPYETTKVNEYGDYETFGSLVQGSADENAPLYQMPEYNKKEEVNTPTDDNNQNEDNNATLKDFFDKENLKDNIKSILPIGLGAVTLVALLSLIVKKKK